MAAPNDPSTPAPAATSGAKRAPVPPSQRPPTLGHRAQLVLAKGLVGWLATMPLERARRIGERIGMLGYWPLGIRKGVVTRQIAAAFPGLDDAQVRTIARKAYAHIGRVFVEAALVGRLGRNGVLSMFEEESDIDVIRKHLAGGRGIIAFAGHVGSWELTGAYLAALGIPTDAVARRMNNPLFDAFVNEARTSAGIVVIYDNEAVRRIPRSMKEGRLVGLIADQGVMGLASSYVPFFGRPAKTPKGPAVFALRYKVPIIFLGALLQPSGKYRFYATEIEPADTGDRERDVDETVARFTAALERVVRRYPEQYFWHHRRWKRQPPDTPPELREP